jgi:hypothetical protein
MNQHRQVFLLEPQDKEESFNKLDRSMVDEMLQQEYQVYLQSQSVKKESLKGADALLNIDYIPESIVAKFDIKNFLAETERCPLCAGMKEAIKWIDPEKDRRNLKMATPAEQRKAAVAKGVPNGVRPPTSLVSAAIRKLSKRSGLFKPRRELVPRAKAGAFFVKKANGLWRTITDGSFSNSFFEKEQGKFSLFTIETVRQVIDNLSVDPNNTEEPAEWYAINVDLRHWFHQLPLPPRLQSYFAIEMTDRNNRKDLPAGSVAETVYLSDDEEDPEDESPSSSNQQSGSKQPFLMYPQAVPMGWTLAPRIAHSISWCLLLGNSPTGKNQLGVQGDVPSEVLENLKKAEHPPVWLPFKHGGGIFVLLDNILIVSSRKKVTDWWFERLMTTAEKYHAIVKCEAGDDVTSEVRFNSVREHCYHTMSPGQDRSFNFCGVDWRHSSHAVPVKEKTMELPDFQEKSLRFESRRALASILGKILWHRRIHRIKYYDGSQASRSIRSLYSRISPEHQKQWDASFEISPSEMVGLKEAWEKRFSEEEKWRSASPVTQTWNWKEMKWAATDASSSDGLAAAVIFSAFSEAAEGVWKWHHGCRDHTQIALAELIAIVNTVEGILQEGSQKLIVIATDSQNAKNWIEKGFARNEKALPFLKKLDELLNDHRCRLYLTYIHTSINVADDPSHNRDIDNNKSQMTYRHLRQTYSLAQGMWSKEGEKIGGENRERE